MTNPRGYYVGMMGARLARRIPLSDPVHFPVTAVLCGRRNNVPEPNSERPADPPSQPRFPFSGAHGVERGWGDAFDELTSLQVLRV